MNDFTHLIEKTRIFVMQNARFSHLLSYKLLTDNITHRQAQNRAQYSTRMRNQNIF